MGNMPSSVTMRAAPRAVSSLTRCGQRGTQGAELVPVVFPADVRYPAFGKVRQELIA